jgi:hypothetical protein
MKRYLIAAIALALVGCEPGELSPALPVGGAIPVGGGSAVRPLPAAPPNQQMARDPGNVSGQQETHGVVNRSDCSELERKFQNQGRRIRLVDRIRSTNPGAALQWICVFEGEDAQEGYFDDNRLKN